MATEIADINSLEKEIKGFNPNLRNNNGALAKTINNKPKIEEISKWFTVEIINPTSNKQPIQLSSGSGFVAFLKKIPSYDKCSLSNSKFIKQSPVRGFIYEDNKYRAYGFKEGGWMKFDVNVSLKLFIQPEVGLVERLKLVGAIKGDGTFVPPPSQDLPTLNKCKK